MLDTLKNDKYHSYKTILLIADFETHYETHLITSKYLMDFELLVYWKMIKEPRPMKHLSRLTKDDDHKTPTIKY